MSCSYFYKWLFGTEMFSGLSRNAHQAFMWTYGAPYRCIRCASLCKNFTICLFLIVYHYCTLQLLRTGNSEVENTRCNLEIAHTM